MARTARMTSTEEVNCPKNAIAARRVTQAAETVALMYVGCIMEVY